VSKDPVGNETKAFRDLEMQVFDMHSEISELREAARYQLRVLEWMITCFGLKIMTETGQRNHRFLEEALELVQANGCTQAEAHMLVDYVFGRPVGKIEQEVGGVMVCLAALCNTVNVDMQAAGRKELERCWANIEKIKEKHRTKPPASPLPGVSS